MSDEGRPPRIQSRGGGPVNAAIRFCLENPLVVGLLTLGFVFWGVMVAPFDWDIFSLPRSPVPVDAIPDIGENQQIVFTEWPGRSPQDVEDQITYPLTSALLGVPRVKTIRSSSMFGFSSIYVIFEEGADFYWTRSRVLEKLSSLSPDLLPEGVQPTLGPDATALGQVYWYTLEGRGPDGEPQGGWDLDELRSVQDWHVRYALLSAEGISEVASVGGFVREYQVDVDPDAMRAAGVTLEDVFAAVRASNIDVGAGTVELNRVEYVIRGLGFIKKVEDISKAVIKTTDGTPIYVSNVGRVTLGPQPRRGALDKSGAEAVGGVVVVRYGYNPLAAIRHVKEKVAEIAPGLPERAVIDFARVSSADVAAFAESEGFEAFDGALPNQEAWLEWLRSAPRSTWPSWVTTSKVTVVPFYDRTGLIYETLGTLNSALRLEVVVTVIVVIVMVAHLGSSLIISAALPLTVLVCFIAMKTFGVDANIVALSGIAIAIGTIVDMGIIVTENILHHLAAATPDESRLEVVYRATSEVGGAVVTAVSTTVVGFLPVFAMTGAEGKLFRPLAFTKTFALVSSIIVALTIVPSAAHLLLGRKRPSGRRLLGPLLLVAVGVVAWWLVRWWVGIAPILAGGFELAGEAIPQKWRRVAPFAANLTAVVYVGALLTSDWLPLGPERGFLRNLVFVGGLIGVLLLAFYVFRVFYARILTWCLDHKIAFLSLPLVLVIVGATIWFGFDRVFGFMPDAARQTAAWDDAKRTFPGLGKEFMPPLDEGSYLLMPTTMPHAGIGEALDIISKQDMAIAAVPEVESSVGKIGRAETALDPAPVSMIETVVNYKSEYVTDQAGRRVNFRFDEDTGEFVRDADGDLIPDSEGRPYRQWRDHIRSPDDIWDEIEAAAAIPGTTRAPNLQPIAARIVMLQSGTRAPMAVKVQGPDLATIERVGFAIERYIKEVPGVEAAAVTADRIIGKPYLEIEIDREAAARYGLSVQQVQDTIETAIGGKQVTSTVEGRERYGVRVRYLRELRDNIESLQRILVGSMGAQVPLGQVARLKYTRGPMEIKSEDGFLVGYVLFDKRAGYAEVDIVEDCRRYLEEKRAIGEFVLPPGVSYRFAGTYENQVRAQKTLAVVLPGALFVIFIILYFQFRSVPTTALVFSGIVVAWAGGFILIWLYGRPWFLDFSVFGVNMRDLFQVHSINLSVAIWVGFLALFGIASDDGVVMATYLDQSFAAHAPESVEEVRKATLAGAVRRVRPCLMTTATTILALLPVLTSTGRGADVMVPMAIPSFGGMLIEVSTMLVVPVLYAAIKEHRVRRRGIH